MAVLTISRDIGSGGLELARCVAEQANYRIADKVVIERIMREYGFVDFDRSYESPGGFWSAEDEITERTLSFLDRVVRAIAKLDRMIIVGRGGFAPLSGCADAIHIRATAPLGTRILRVMEERGITDHAQAEKLVQRRDRIRRSFVARYYGTRWEDSSPFDLTVNVDAFGVGPLAELLTETLRAIDAKPREDPSVQTLVVDELLLEVAKKQIAEASLQLEDD